MKVWIIVVIGGVLSQLVLPQDVLAATDTKGAALYQTCISCHGKSGEGNSALQAPALTGQTVDYIARQLRYFQSGIRGTHSEDKPGQQMRAMASMLKSEEDLLAVAGFIATLPTTKAGGSSQGDKRRGGNLYQGNCGACHGGKAEGNPLLQAPRLAGLSGDYIRRQYQYFQRGIRGADASDKPGGQMRLMASTLPDEKALEDVISYILQLESL